MNFEEGSRRIAIGMICVSILAGITAVMLSGSLLAGTLAATGSLVVF